MVLDLEDREIISIEKLLPEEWDLKESINFERGLEPKDSLEIGEARGISVDEHGRTSDKDIFAAGDCAEKKSFFTQKPSRLRLASIASNEGRIVGANLFQLKRRNEGVIGTFATIVGDFGLAMADRHPGSMPDASQQGVKLVFEKASGKILGGQITGGKSIAEMANVIATLIQQKMTANEIATFPLGTHPAYTASPVSYPIVNAAEMASLKI